MIRIPRGTSTFPQFLGFTLTHPSRIIGLLVSSPLLTAIRSVRRSKGDFSKLRLNRIVVLLTSLTCLFFAQHAMAAPETVSFSNVSGAQVSFQGSNSGVGTFTFPPAGAGQSDFKITGEQNFAGPNALLNLLGDIQGVFSFTAPAVASNPETANVTGQGTFLIHDGDVGNGGGTGCTLGVGCDFTATLVWNTISSSGTFDLLNQINGDVNLTNFQYAGSNSQLQELAARSAGTVTASFTFGVKKDLISLADISCNPCAAPFGGQLAATPEPAYSGLVLLGMLALAHVVRRHRTA